VIDALDIRVRGIVQGVGFRPFVYRLARRYLVSGWVLNDLDGVFIHAEAESQLLDEFVTELHMNPPAAARISEVELKEVPLQDCTEFEIRESAAEDVDEGTLVSADLGLCDDCARELFNPHDRRFRYPFINCTNCGPRFTIIDSLPYDRPATSMRDFAMCDDCAREYADPADRRFHAQPDACFECGPCLSWKDAGADDVVWGRGRAESDAIIERAVNLLSTGGILAVKGLGGFHLACDAANEQAIAELRRRKRRNGKAFAVLAASVEEVRAVCEASPEEEALLKSPARPIVLLKKRPGALLAAGLADGLPELGVMLAATPVQALLAHDFQAETGRGLLVMTSGNVHDEPIVTDDADAFERLGSIADAFLGNDRAILSRYDDSVVRVVNLGGVNERGEQNLAVQFIRRARGYAPVPLSVSRPVRGGGAAEVPEGVGDEAPSHGGAVGAKMTSNGGHPAVFAAGSEQKNTFTFLREGEAFVSQHIGDMEDADVYDAWLEAKARFEKLFDMQVQVLACDAHPEYLASKWARAEALRTGASLTEVQHHHAHIASVLGEHGLFGPCCGIAFDGTGYGADGAIWGGEVLLANQADYERFANFTYVPMPGGAAAIKHPLRMAYGALWAYDLLDHPGAQPALEALGEQAAVCEQMIENGLNTPYTSSVGRLFDAVSAILGVCHEPTYEGEAAILLDAVRSEAAKPGERTARVEGGELQGGDEPGESGCGHDGSDKRVGRDDAGERGEHDGVAERYAVLITKNSATEVSTAHDTSVVLLDAEPTLRAALDDLAAGVPVPAISLRFHQAMVGAIVQVAELVRAMYGIQLVALSGGCFMNRFLLEESSRLLGERGFTVAVNGNLPPNDGCISFGQAVVAAAS